LVLYISVHEQAYATDLSENSPITQTAAE